MRPETLLEGCAGGGLDPCARNNILPGQIREVLQVCLLLLPTSLEQILRRHTLSPFHFREVFDPRLQPFFRVLGKHSTFEADRWGGLMLSPDPTKAQ